MILTSSISVETFQAREIRNLNVPKPCDGYVTLPNMQQI